MQATQEHQATGRHRVVIIGSGFGGLFAARALKNADVDVTLISGTTHHLFQPLLYQVATGILSEGLIAPSTREVLARQKNAQVFFGHVTDIDVDKRQVVTDALDQRQVYDYDSLIVAAGAGQSYFGNDQFARFAPGMKSIDDALELRGRIFGSFELAEMAAASGRTDDVTRLMTFVVVGAGATGVEMAGQIAELSKRTLPHDFRAIKSQHAHIVLLDAMDKVLPPYGDRLGGKAKRRLEKLGVTVTLGSKVVDVDAEGIEYESHDGTRHRIEALCKVWAAGVSASPLGRMLAERTGAQVDRNGRVHVEKDLTLPGHPEIFVVGDMIALGDLPGVAQVAIQGGKYAAKRIKARLAGEPDGKPFHYFDKGSMATVSRFSAVAKIGKVEVSGFVAWVMWLGVHLVYIIGFKSQIGTFFHWIVSFLGRGRGERTSTEQQIYARIAIQKLGEDFTPSITNSDVDLERSRSLAIDRLAGETG